MMKVVNENLSDLSDNGEEEKRKKNSEIIGW